LNSKILQQDLDTNPVKKLLNHCNYIVIILLQTKDEVFLNVQKKQETNLKSTIFIPLLTSITEKLKMWLKIKKLTHEENKIYKQKKQNRTHIYTFKRKPKIKSTL
jgi:hypothetical protein